MRLIFWKISEKAIIYEELVARFLYYFASFVQAIYEPIMLKGNVSIFSFTLGVSEYQRLLELA